MLKFYVSEKRDSHAGNYSQEKNIVSVWSCAMHGRLQRRKTCTSLPRKRTEIDNALPGKTPSGLWRDVKPMDMAWDDVCLKALERDEWKEWTAGIWKYYVM